MYSDTTAVLVVANACPCLPVTANPPATTPYKSRRSTDWIGSAKDMAGTGRDTPLRRGLGHWQNVTDMTPTSVVA
jgi:hypothetical protein